MENLWIKELADEFVVIQWEKREDADGYRVYWSDKDTPTMKYRLMEETKDCVYTLHKATHVPHYFKVAAVREGKEQWMSQVLATPVKKVFQEHLEALGRGLVAVKVKNGIFLSWRMFLYEVEGYSSTGMTGADYAVFRNGREIARVADSTNYLDREGSQEDVYAVAPVICGERLEACQEVSVWEHEYLDIPIQAPEGGVTPSGQSYVYHANDMSVGDVDGDGEYEYIVKWDPTNSQDVSIKGYTGKCYLDCYKLDGTLLWRLDMGVNIRAGAHYTQFMVYDFNLDGKAEMAVKTAPGTKMTRFHADGSVAEERYITMPQSDVDAGYSHEDNYVCSAQDYREHMVEVFMGWHEHPEVVGGQWPKTLEECFGLEKKYSYPLCREDAQELAEYFIHTFAPSKSPKNELDKFEGFIFKGPEYLTMFAGDGTELETIPFKIGRVDDGLMWGDYAMKRIEPCNRVDRFLSGVAYLDGERPYLIICRGYYTRATVTAYDFFHNTFHECFCADSGFVPMRNPFDDNRRPQNTSALRILDQQCRLRMILVDHDFFLHAEKTLKINQTVEELGRLLRIKREFCPVLLSIDGQIADNLSVLLRKRGQLKRNRQVLSEMKLTEIVQISGIIPVVPVEGHCKKGPFPFARHMREIGFRIDGNGCFGRIQNLLEKFRQSGKFQTGILSRAVGGKNLLRFDGVFRMMQTCRHGMTAECVRICLAGAGCGIRPVRESLHLHSGYISFGVAEYGPQNPGQGFMTAEQFSGFQNCFPLFKNLFGGSLH